MELTANPLFLVAIGLVGGLFGGMLGLGGGWLFGPSLSILGLTAVHAVGTSIAAMAAQACMSVYRYHKSGRLRIRIGLSFGAFAIAGMESGQKILRHLAALGVADVTLRGLYVGALVLIGWSVWPRASHQHSPQPTTSKPRLQLPGPRTILYEAETIAWLALGLIGFFVGNLSGILGIGGGTVMVPLLAAIYRMPMSAAVPTSLLSILCASGYGLVVNALSHSIQLQSAAYLVIGAITGGQLGASMAMRADERLLKRLFACLAWLTAGSVSLRMAEFRLTAFVSLLVGAASLAVVAIMIVQRQRR